MSGDHARQVRGGASADDEDLHPARGRLIEQPVHAGGRAVGRGHGHLARDAELLQVVFALRPPGRFARLLHGTLPVEVERYSRRVTAAWTIFFATLFALSCTLYFGGFLAAWSVLANILSPILTVAMFMVEYAIRHRVLPQWERVGLLGGIRAFSRHFG